MRSPNSSVSGLSVRSRIGIQRTETYPMSACAPVSEFAKLRCILMRSALPYWNSPQRRTNKCRVTHRLRHTQTQTQIDIVADGQTQRQTEHRQTTTQKERHRHTHTHTQTERHRRRNADREKQTQAQTQTHPAHMDCVRRKHIYAHAQ